MREIKLRCWNAAGEKITYDDDWVYEWRHIKQSHESGRIILMQYTGIRDKNGVEVYEGDVIISFECHDGFNPLVGKVSFGADGKWIIEDSDSKYIEDLCEYADELKVIGNIYENPELLK